MCCKDMDGWTAFSAADFAWPSVSASKRSFLDHYCNSLVNVAFDLVYLSFVIFTVVTAVLCHILKQFHLKSFDDSLGSGLWKLFLFFSLLYYNLWVCWYQRSKLIIIAKKKDQSYFGVSPCSDFMLPPLLLSDESYISMTHFIFYISILLYLVRSHTCPPSSPQICFCLLCQWAGR